MGKCPCREALAQRLDEFERVAFDRGKAQDALSRHVAPYQPTGATLLATWLNSKIEVLCSPSPPPASATKTPSSRCCACALPTAPRFWKSAVAPASMPSISRRNLPI